MLCNLVGLQIFVHVMVIACDVSAVAAYILVVVVVVVVVAAVACCSFL